MLDTPRVCHTSRPFLSFYFPSTYILVINFFCYLSGLFALTNAGVESTHAYIPLDFELITVTVGLD